MYSNVKISKWIIILGATIGCVIQLQETLISYFEYDTVTRTTYVTSEYLELVTLSMCTPYVEVIDYKMLKKEKNVDLEKLTRGERHRKLQDIVTIRDILTYTHSENDVIVSCAIRSTSTRVNNRMNSPKECYEIFHLKKYYTQEFVCYAIIPKQFDIPYRTYHTTVDAPGTIYFLNINETFANKIRYLNFVVHSKGLPYQSKQYRAVTYDTEANTTLYKISYHRHKMQYLGYPYSKFTCSKNWKTFTTCLEKCVISKSIAKYNKISHDLNLIHPYDYHHISMNDAADEKISRDLDNMMDQCRNNCTDRYCTDSYCMTGYEASKYDTFAIILSTPTSPDISIHFHPSLKLLDLFVYVMGAIGAWFGIAFINIDPIKSYEWIQTNGKIFPKKNRKINQIHPYWWRQVNDDLF